MRKIIFLFLFFYFTSNILAQKNIPKLNKNILEKIDYKKTKEIQKLNWNPSPLKAALCSAVIPGLGQLYNKRHLKSPLVAGALTGGLMLSLYQRNIYKKHHLNYINAVNGIKSPDKENLNVNQYYEIERSAKRYYNYVVLFTIIGYVLNIMDSFVDAHLDEIRKDKELNQLSIYPSISPSFFASNKLFFSMTLNFKF